MASKKRKPIVLTNTIVEEKVRVSVDTPKKKKLKAPLQSMLSFNRWFAQTGKPAHHRAGMLACITKKLSQSKRTLESWNRLFASY